MAALDDLTELLEGDVLDENSDDERDLSRFDAYDPDDEASAARVAAAATARIRAAAAARKPAAPLSVNRFSNLSTDSGDSSEDDEPKDNQPTAPRSRTISPANRFDSGIACDEEAEPAAETKQIEVDVREAEVFTTPTDIPTLPLETAVWASDDDENSDVDDEVFRTPRAQLPGPRVVYETREARSETETSHATSFVSCDTTFEEAYETANEDQSDDEDEAVEAPESPEDVNVEEPTAEDVDATSALFAKLSIEVAAPGAQTSDAPEPSDETPQAAGTTPNEIWQRLAIEIAPASSSPPRAPRSPRENEYTREAMMAIREEVGYAEPNEARYSLFEPLVYRDCHRDAVVPRAPRIKRNNRGGYSNNNNSNPEQSRAAWNQFNNNRRNNNTRGPTWSNRFGDATDNANADNNNDTPANQWTTNGFRGFQDPNAQQEQGNNNGGDEWNVNEETSSSGNNSNHDPRENPTISLAAPPGFDFGPPPGFEAPQFSPPGLANLREDQAGFASGGDSTLRGSEQESRQPYDNGRDRFDEEEQRNYDGYDESMGFQQPPPGQFAEEDEPPRRDSFNDRRRDEEDDRRNDNGQQTGYYQESSDESDNYNVRLDDDGYDRQYESRRSSQDEHQPDEDKFDSRIRARSLRSDNVEERSPRRSPPSSEQTWSQRREQDERRNSSRRNDDRQWPHQRREEPNRNANQGRPSVWTRVTYDNDSDQENRNDRTRDNRPQACEPRRRSRNVDGLDLGEARRAHIPDDDRRPERGSTSKANRYETMDGRRDSYRRDGRSSNDRRRSDSRERREEPSRPASYRSARSEVDSARGRTVEPPRGLGKGLRDASGRYHYTPEDLEALAKYDQERRICARMVDEKGVHVFPALHDWYLERGQIPAPVYKQPSEATQWARGESDEMIHWYNPETDMAYPIDNEEIKTWFREGRITARSLFATYYQGPFFTYAALSKQAPFTYIDALRKESEIKLDIDRFAEMTAEIHEVLEKHGARIA